MSNIILRAINENDENNILKWRNSDEVRKYLYTQTELTPEIHHNWLKTQVYTNKCYQFIIEVSDHCGNNKPIGTVYIKNIDYYNSKGEYGIYIGQPNERGNGYASATINKVLEFAFSELNLNRVYLTAYYDNFPSIKVALKAGFEFEAVLRDEILRYDGYADVVCMGINKQKWKNRVRRVQ